MTELKERESRVAGPKKKWISVNIDNGVYAELKVFVDEEHPLRPTLKSAVAVAIEHWIETERAKLA